MYATFICFVIYTTFKAIQHKAILQNYIKDYSLKYSKNEIKIFNITSSEVHRCDNYYYSSNYCDTPRPI